MEIEKITLCLKALGDEKRLQLLTLIRDGTQCNCEFSEKLNIQPNLASHHLRILKEAGLVNIERDPNDSRWIYYTINRVLYQELQEFLISFLDPEKIQPRQPLCGPISDALIISKMPARKNQ